MNKQKLYIINFATKDSDREIEWFWATNEDEARKQYHNYIKELGWDGEADILDIYEVGVPQEVIDSYTNTRPLKNHLTEFKERLQIIFDNSTLGDIPEIQKEIDTIIKKIEA